MQVLISMLMKFFSDVFSDVIKDQLNTLGETTDVEEEKGILENDADLSVLIDELDGVYHWD